MEYARAVRNALPEAARVRMQSKLLQEEWDVPVRNWQDMGAIRRGGGGGERLSTTARKGWLHGAAQLDQQPLDHDDTTLSSARIDIQTTHDPHARVAPETQCIRVLCDQHRFAGQVSMVRVGSGGRWSYHDQDGCEIQYAAWSGPRPSSSGGRRTRVCGCLHC